MKEKLYKNVINNYLWQIIVAITASFTAASIAIGHGWTSPVLPYLKSNSSEFPIITETEGTWIATSFDIGSISSAVLHPMLASFMGRKYFLFNSAILQVISWTLIVFAQNIITICIARFIYGIAASTAINFGLMYIGEIAQKNIRSRLIFLLKIISSSAHLTVKIVGAFLSFKMMNVTMLCLILPVILIIPFIPESPYYLLLRDRKEEALESLMKLRGKSKESVNSELVRVKNTVKESQENKEWAFRELFFVKGNRKSLYVVLIASVIPFMAGKVTIIAHTQEIMSYSEFSISAKESTVMIGVIELITFCIGSLIIECCGRRKLFLIYGILTWLNLVFLGLFFFAQIYLLLDLNTISWFPFVMLVFYTIVMNLGLFTIHYVLVGEALGFKVKILGTSLTIISCDITIFCSKAVFDVINSFAGIYANFWMYSVFCFVGTIAFYIIAPETKGKTLEEIQAIFHSDK